MRRERRSRTASLVGTSDLTIVAPLRPGFVPALDAVTYRTRARRVLRALHVGRAIAHEQDLARVLSDAVERVGRIHSVRIAVLEPQDAIMLAVTYDGDFESYVRVIWQKVARLLDLIFCNTVDYVCGGTASFEDWARWLRGRQVETPFLYATPGLTYDDIQWHRAHTRAVLRAGGEHAEDRQVDTPVASAEAVAYGRQTDGRDPSELLPMAETAGFDAGIPAFRQGLRALVGLHRLVDLYPAGTDDGAILLRAAVELLPEFERARSVSEVGMDRARERFGDALDWYDEGLARWPSARVRRRPPDEPVLHRPQTIQAGILEPLPDCSHGVLLMLGFASGRAMAGFLGRCVPTVHRAGEHAAAAVPDEDDMTVNVAVTAAGLERAGLSEREIDALPEPFVQGMHRRAGLLGDVRYNHPRHWRLPMANWAQGIAAPDAGADDPGARVDIDAVHALVQLRLCVPPDATTRSDARRRLLARLEALVGGDPQVLPLSLQWMTRLRAGDGPDPNRVVDHFGFVDGMSDPVLSKAQAGRRFENHVHAGEALVGYGNAADEPAVPEGEAPPEGTVAAFLHNGSFLVVRKLRQDLGALEALLERAAPLVDRDTVLGKMMGRWPVGHPRAGEPLVGLPDATRPNDFAYRRDPAGRLCPFHAHVRRANPRASTVGEIEGPASRGARAPRLFRRGLSYGAPLERGAADPQARARALEQERGLVFMAYNASLGEQFEVVQRWLAGGNSSGSSSEPGDPFLGVAEAGRPRGYRFRLDDGRLVHLTLDGSEGLHDEPRPLVRLEWGLYAFAPSTSGLAWLRERAASAEPAALRGALPWRLDAGRERLAALRRIEAASDAATARDAWKAALEDADAIADFDAAALWAAIREDEGGVTSTPYGVLVARHELVEQVLRDTGERVGMGGYLERMNHAFGPIFLGMDADSAGYRREAPAGLAALATFEPEHEGRFACSTTTDRLDAIVERARQMALADESMRRSDVLGLEPRRSPRWEAAVDARELVDHLLARLCEKWFGLSEDGGHFARGGFHWTWREGEPPRYPGHFVAPSRWFFQPHPERTVERIGSAHGQALRGAMDGFLRDYGATLTQPAVREILDADAAREDATYASRTLIGLVMGFVPTLDGLLRRIAHQWSVDGTLAMLRSVASGGDANRLDTVFGAEVARAVQLRATPDTVWRTARTDFVIGDPAGAHVAVRKGEPIVLGLASSTQQMLERGHADLAPAFGGEREGVGGAPHGCPGRRLAMEVVEGFLRALVASPHPLRAGPVPGSLVIEGRLPEAELGGTPGPSRIVRPARQGIDAAVAAQPVDASILGDVAGPSRIVRPMRMRADGRVVWASPTPAQLEVLEGPADAEERQVLLRHLPFFGFRSPVPVWVIGDSWLYNVPALWDVDLVDALGDVGYRVVHALSNRYSHLGRTLAAMASPDLIEMYRQDLIDAIDGGTDTAPKAILLGGGGNDLIDPAQEGRRHESTLHALLKGPAGSAQDAVDETVLADYLRRMQGHLDRLIEGLADAADVPLLIHGYDHPIPDGRDVFSSNIGDLGRNIEFADTPGPWLDPVFRLRGMHDQGFNAGVMRHLIDRLNATVRDTVAAHRKRGRNVYHLDFAGTLGGPDGYGAPGAAADRYRHFWRDELHPTSAGHDLLAAVAARQLADLGLKPA